MSSKQKKMSSFYYCVDSKGEYIYENNVPLLTDKDGNLFIEQSEQHGNDAPIAAPVPTSTDTNCREVNTRAENTSTAEVASRSKASCSKLSWTRSNTLLLLEAYAKFRKDLTSDIIKRDEAWNSVASELSANGFPVPGERCKWKFNKLKAKYIKKKDNKGPSCSGASRFEFEYFEEMDEIFRNCPAVRPVEISGNRRAPALPEIAATNDIVECYSDVEEELPVSPPRKKKTIRDSIIEHNERMESLKKKEMSQNEQFRSRMLASVENLTECMNRNSDKFSNLLQQIIEKM